MIVAISCQPTAGTTNKSWIDSKIATIADDIKKGEWPSAVNAAQTSLDSLSHYEIDPENHVKLLTKTGMLQWKLGETDLAYTNLKKALSAAKKNNLEEPLGQILYNLGEIHYIKHYVIRDSQLDSVKKYHYQSLDAFEKVSDTVGMVHSLSRLGVIHEREREID